PPLKAQLLLEESLSAYFPEMVFTDSGITVQLHRNTQGLQNGTDPVIFDAIKVSHHGSLHNTNVELLSLIDAPIYLISSDGSRHGHPDFEVLAEIVDRPARESANKYPTNKK
ncbi:hypothetical protein, partial [Aeromonas caviae]|uniref:hypothetical protein n=1 Tax=Aeromonas caviae TaxID=648 RepID=UPI001FC8CA9A